MSKFNPFATVLYEGETAPYSRVFETTIGERFDDTLQVWNGGLEYSLNPFTWDKRSSFSKRAGLFDYATFGISRLANAGFVFTGVLIYGFSKVILTGKDFDDNDLNQSFPMRFFGNLLLVAPFILAFAVFAPLHIALNLVLRPIVSVLATVIFSPIVVASHMIANIIAFFIAKKIEKTEITPATVTYTYDNNRRPNVSLKSEDANKHIARMLLVGGKGSSLATINVKKYGIPHPDLPNRVYVVPSILASAGNKYDVINGGSLEVTSVSLSNRNFFTSLATINKSARDCLVPPKEMKARYR